MRGLAVGEQSTKTSPVLQLLVRQGPMMVDIVSGTFRIESIVSLSGAPVVLVADTPLDIRDVADGGHRLGLGRYAIETGVTGGVPAGPGGVPPAVAAWSVGTHRVVCTFVLVAGGPTYTQVIEFEMLTAADWPTGAAFHTYATTRRIYQDGFVDEAVVTRAQLHRWLRKFSASIELWCGRCLEARYATWRLDGGDRPMLFLPDAALALESVTDTDGVELFLAEDYVLYNALEDRNNPKLVLTAESAGWPYGRKNIVLTGLFGYTDPDPELDESAPVGLGHVPDDIVQALGILITDVASDPTLAESALSSRMTSMKTRDQAVTFATGGGSIGSESMTGNAALDQLLFRYGAPLNAGYVEDLR